MRSNSARLAVYQKFTFFTSIVANIFGSHVGFWVQRPVLWFDPTLFSFILFHFFDSLLLNQLVWHHLSCYYDLCVGFLNDFLWCAIRLLFLMALFCIFELKVSTSGWPNLTGAVVSKSLFV